MKQNYPKNFFLTLILLYSWSILFPQVQEFQSNNRLSADFYRGRREALRKIMPDNSVFVVFASPVRTFSSDVNYVYHQNPDMFYFSAYTEPYSMMYIFKDEQRIDEVPYPFSEVIFTPVQPPAEVVYTGKKMGVEGAMKELEIKLAIEITN